MAATTNVLSDDPTGFFVPGEPVRGIRDVIHDEIPIHSYLNRFIDTETFQRLRDIKQLGTSSYVWPTASHSRFEHSLGVAYLARDLTSRLRNKQPELGITDRDIACVEIAGLCHDLGHGPWSHVWDGIFMPQAVEGCTWKHEQGSEMMFDYMVKTDKIPISDKDVRFIKALIAGEPAQCDPSEKRFLFDIVANKRNGLDVDKFDYIQRDSWMTGEPLSFPAKRVIKSARVIDNEICYNIKDANQVYEICQRRFGLHKHVYNHKTARAIEYMIVDALLLAEPHMHIADRVNDPESFLYLTDHIMKEIEMSQQPELEASRHLLKRIKHRKLYRCVDNKNIEFPFAKATEDYVTTQRVFNKIVAIRGSPEYQKEGEGNVSDLIIDDIIVDFSMMHHGMKQHNPVDFIKFYSKHNTSKAMNTGPGDYSELRPTWHAEGLLRVYTKKIGKNYQRLVKAAYEAVMDDLDGPDTAVVDSDNNSGTSPAATQTPAASGSEPLPDTPGSEGTPAGRGRFERVRSRNRFTSLPATTPAASTPSITSRSSTLNSIDSVKTVESDPTDSPFTAVNLGGSGNFDDLFQDEDMPDDLPAVGAKRGRESDPLGDDSDGAVKRRK